MLFDKLRRSIRNLFEMKLQVWTDQEKESWKNRFLYLFDETGISILEHIITPMGLQGVILT